jgi:hypothetical protein
MKHEKLDQMDIITNITSIVFKANGQMNNQVQADIADTLFGSPIKTAWDCEVEYNETNDNYKSSLDIPTAQAMVDMGCADNGYLELRTQMIRGYRGKCCKSDPDLKEADLTNNEAGRMDLCHFTELCVPIKNRLYRLEVKTGREIQKHKDIFWIKNKINCTIQEAERFKVAFELLNLDKNVVFKIVFGECKKDPGIQNTGNKHLEYYETLAEEMKEFKLENLKMSLYQEDSDGNDIDEMYQNSLDPEVMEMNFKEDLPVDSNIFTLKRLSIPEESLSEEEIADIKEASYDRYKEILKIYMEKKKLYTKKRRQANDFRFHPNKINDTKISTSISMAWEYIQEAKAKFNAIKEALVNETMEIGLEDTTYDAIEAYKLKPSSSTRYRILKSIHGGEWDGVIIPKASPGEIEICWRVLNGKM